MGNFFFVLRNVLAQIPVLAVRLADQRVQVETALLQDGAEQPLVLLRHLVVVAQAPQDQLLGVVQKLVDVLVQQPPPEYGFRTLPRLLHGFSRKGILLLLRLGRGMFTQNVRGKEFGEYRGVLKRYRIYYSHTITWTS